MEENTLLSKTAQKRLEREEHETELEQRRQELQNEFRPTGWKTVRKELFAHLRDPQITIRPDSVTFNTSCIGSLENVVYVHFHIHEGLKRLAIEGCDENDKDALRWCIEKPDKRKSRKMTCKPFAKGLYDLLGWKTDKYYKVLGYKIEFEGHSLFVFDLTVAEIKDMPKSKNKETDEDISITYEENNEEDTETGDSSTGEEETINGYEKDVVSSFGIPLEEHRDVSTYTNMDGYVSVGLLNGKPTLPGDGKS